MFLFWLFVQLVVALKAGKPLKTLVKKKKIAYILRKVSRLGGARMSYEGDKRCQRNPRLGRYCC